MCPKRCLSLFSKLIAGKLHCMGTNSPQEIWACDLDIHHCIPGEFFFFFIIWDFATIYLALVFLLRFLGMNMVKVCYLLVAHPRFSISLHKFHVSLCIMFNILKPLWASERILRYIYIYIKEVFCTVPVLGFKYLIPNGQNA